MVGDCSGMSQQSISRIVRDVVEAIARLRDEFIYMPRDREELNTNFKNFFKIGPFPTVVGTIDCTHVKICGQGGQQGETFRNRKQYFSINVQSVSRADLSFQDIVARWAGSTHDSFVFGLRCKLETALTVIVASAILHNFCIEQKDDMPLESPEIEEAVEATTIAVQEGTERIEAATGSSNRQAVAKRDWYVQQILNARA